MNSFSFRYSAVSYEGEDRMYTDIAGRHDEAWSNWTTATAKEYGNLSEGRYTFRVKGKNVFGIESQEASYQFTVLPPWYRTLWAFIAYAITAGLLVYAIVLLNLRRLKRANIMLEKSVRERTSEVVRQKEEIP
jgi:sensor c-di-GMP phosphodiesterase-like protein